MPSAVLFTPPSAPRSVMSPLLKLKARWFEDPTAGSSLPTIVPEVLIA